MDSNKLGKNFSFGTLVRFALPTVAMMVILSLYSIVDAAFISRLVGKNALSAVNIVFPVLNIVQGVGIMLATGGSAIIARKLGEGKGEEAKREFSFLILITLGAGVVLAIAGILLLEPLVRMLGSSDLLFADASAYLGTALLFSPVTMLQMCFMTFFVTAGRPNLGMLMSILSGLANGVLDYVFIAPAGMGVAGAALATGVGQLFPVVAGLVLFFRKRGSLYFGRPKGSLRFVGQSCFNGSSEMVSNLAMGLTTFLFNHQMMKLIGEDGVAAITIIMCLQFILSAVLMGFSMGVAPVVSYDYGKGDKPLLRKVIRNSLIFICGASALMFALSPLVGPLVVKGFTDDASVREIAMGGILPYSFSFLLCGVNIFVSSLYTAFSNGKVSALLSFLRTGVLLSAGILLLPLWQGVLGVWLAVPAAELLALLLSVFFLVRSRKTYGY